MATSGARCGCDELHLRGDGGCGQRLGRRRGACVGRRDRGAIVEVRHNTNSEDRARGLNRAEVLRIIAEVHKTWAKAAQRNRAESLNQWVKRHWPDKRGPAVGKERQRLRLTFASIGLNIISALHHEKRTGVDILASPGNLAEAA